MLAHAHPAPALAQIEPWPGVPFDFIESKVRVPTLRPGIVSRTALVNRLRAASVPVAAVVAPPGYGKTTLLAQWAGRDARPFVWVTLDERDNDPVVLLRHVAAALDRIVPLGSSVLGALASPRSSIWRAAVPRLGSALLSLAAPLVLVLDDVHVLETGDSADAVAALADHLQPGSMLVVAGRTAPQLPIASLRASGRLVELGPDLLTLTPREARLVIRAAGVELSEVSEAALVDRTEGWAAAVYLGALSIGQGEADDVRGDDRYLADYIRSECLAHLRPKHLTFLRRTSVLPKICAPLCDHVLHRTDSSLELESIDKAGPFLVPLDRRREWFRHRRLFQELLARELAEREPELIQTLNRRAADWFEGNGDPQSALEHADAAGDTDRVARIVSSIGLPFYDGDAVAVVERWLPRLDDQTRLEQHPGLAVLGGWAHVLRGRPAEAERLLDVAEQAPTTGRPPHGSTSLRPCVTVLRAAMCLDGVGQMRAAAEAALDALPARSRWRPITLVLQGAACALDGEDESADAILADAATMAASFAATDVRLLAIAERSLLAAERDDQAAAETLAFEARDLVAGLHGDSPTSALGLAACARAMLRRGRWDEARAQLASARRLTPSLTHALPWLAVQTRLELARAFITLREADAARMLLAEIDEIRRRRPDLGVLSLQTDEVRDALDELCDTVTGAASGLTKAELRLLPLLATHLSFREIGDRLYVSRNTIKTQAISVYRKLGVSSRSEAIDRARELGLVDEAAASQQVDFTPTG
jgi:LuxR family maltose regulon positive regulatory protein